MNEHSQPTGAQVAFHFIKSNFFRVIHADGVWGGATPTGKVHMSFWNHRTAIPQEVFHEVKQDGSIGDEVQALRQGRKGIVREVEVDVVMDLETAKALRQWLDGQITAIEKLFKEDDKKV